jgi:hypothetical protein
MNDLRAFWDRGQSLVVYQHQGHVSAGDLIRNTATLLRDGLDGAESIAIRFNKGTSRIFFVLPKPERRECIEERVARFLEGPWGRHFERTGGL